MLKSISLEKVPGSDADLRETLVEANLPIEDLEDDHRTFYRACSLSGDVIGYAGIEDCGDDVMLRSVTVRAEHRGRGMGRLLVETTLREAGSAREVYLATTTAARFFAGIGFREVLRTDLPPAVLATRQLSSICPSSATIMKLARPQT